MRYPITVVHDQKKYCYIIEHTVIDQRTEHFKLIARNKTVTIESNRPFFRNKGLKYRRNELKVREGDTNVRNRAFMQNVYEQIEKLVAKFLEEH